LSASVIDAVNVAIPAPTLDAAEPAHAPPGPLDEVGVFGLVLYVTLNCAVDLNRFQPKLSVSLAAFNPNVVVVARRAAAPV
jgi:hypothetical protein